MSVRGRRFVGEETREWQPGYRRHIERIIGANLQKLYNPGPRLLHRALDLFKELLELPPAELMRRTGYSVSEVKEAQRRAEEQISACERDGLTEGAMFAAKGSARAEAKKRSDYRILGKMAAMTQRKARP